MINREILIVSPFGLINQKDHPVGSELTIMLKGGPKFPVEMTGPHQVKVVEWNPVTTEGPIPGNSVTLSFSNRDHYLKDDLIAPYRIALVSIQMPCADKSFSPEVIDKASNPRWEEVGRVHDWRNYIDDEVELMWDSFTLPQQIALMNQAQHQADKEDWD